MLIKVNSGKGETYINVELDDIAQVVVSHNGEAGYRYVRGGHSSITLKDGKEYLTEFDEAKRIVEAMRKQDEERLK